jgi:hypothetical protein
MQLRCDLLDGLAGLLELLRLFPPLAAAFAGQAGPLLVPLGTSPLGGLPFRSGSQGFPHLAMVALNHSLQPLGQVLQQVPPVRHLRRSGRSFPNGVAIAAGPIPADDLGPGVFPQPRREGVRLPVREQFDGLVTLQIHEECAVPQAAPKRPVVYAQHARGGTDERGPLADLPQQRIRAHRDPEAPGQPGSGFPAREVRQHPEVGRQLFGAAGVPLDQPGQRLGEHAHRTSGGVTEPAAGAQVDGDALAAPGRVGNPAHIAAMDALAGVAAGRARDRGPEAVAMTVTLPAPVTKSTWIRSDSGRIWALLITPADTSA